MKIIIPLLFAIASARSIERDWSCPTVASTCTKKVTVWWGDCNTVAANNGITLDKFYSLNPSIDSRCSNLYASCEYCVAGPFACPTPAPTCIKTVAIVQGQTCNDVAAANGISTAAFMCLNPSLNSICSNLLVTQRYCVQGTVPGPTPINNCPTTASTCSKTVKVTKGQTCDIVAKANGLSTPAFMGLNPSINSACTDMLADCEYCVAGPGPAPNNNCPTTASTCTKTVYVTKGQTCDIVAKANGLSTPAFMALNPSINSACTDMLADCNYCVAGKPGPDPGACPTDYNPNCVKFFTVQPGNICWDLVNSNPAQCTLESLPRWNPSIHNPSCDNLKPGCKYCVHVPCTGVHC